MHFAVDKYSQQTTPQETTTTTTTATTAAASACIRVLLLLLLPCMASAGQQQQHARRVSRVRVHTRRRRAPSAAAQLPHLSFQDTVCDSPTPGRLTISEENCDDRVARSLGSQCEHPAADPPKPARLRLAMMSVPPGYTPPDRSGDRPQWRDSCSGQTARRR